MKKATKKLPINTPFEGVKAPKQGSKCYYAGMTTIGEKVSTEPTAQLAYLDPSGPKSGKKPPRIFENVRD